MLTGSLVFLACCCRSQLLVLRRVVAHVGTGVRAFNVHLAPLSILGTVLLIWVTVRGAASASADNCVHREALSVESANGHLGGGQRFARCPLRNEGEERHDRGGACGCASRCSRDFRRAAGQGVSGRPRHVSRQGKASEEVRCAPSSAHIRFHADGQPMNCAGKEARVNDDHHIDECWYHRVKKSKLYAL